MNPRTGDTMLITDAISEGLIVADVRSTQIETDKADENKILADRQTVYTLKSVVDPRTGTLISVSEVGEIYPFYDLVLCCVGYNCIFVNNRKLLEMLLIYLHQHVATISQCSKLLVHPNYYKRKE